MLSLATESADDNIQTLLYCECVVLLSKYVKIVLYSLIHVYAYCVHYCMCSVSLCIILYVLRIFIWLIVFIN